MGWFQKTTFYFETFVFRELVLAKKYVNMGYCFALPQEGVISYHAQINHYCISWTIVSYDKKVLQICELKSTSANKPSVFM